MNYIIFLVCLLSFGVGLYKLFEKAGEAGWKAAVPGLNMLVWAKITGRKPIQLLWFFVPIVGLFKLAYMLIDLVNSFGRWGFWQQFAAVVFPFIYIPYLGFAPSKEVSTAQPEATPKPEVGKRKTGNSPAVATSKIDNSEAAFVNYIGPSLDVPKDKHPHKSALREWAEAILFAVFAAHFIRMFFIEAYTIPTPSMEGTMKVGDFLFVSKMHYGARVPSRPLALPLVHNVVPFTGGESYFNWPIWSPTRLPAISEVKRYDPFVFNYPEGDTVYPNVDYPQQYHNIMHTVFEQDVPNKEAYRQRLLSQPYVVRPVDKRDHYVKRCVGLPGDIIQVKNRELIVNGTPSELIPNMQYDYLVYASKGKKLDVDAIEDKNDVDVTFQRIDGTDRAELGRIDSTGQTIYQVSLAVPQADRIIGEWKTAGWVDSVVVLTQNSLQYPYNKKLCPWTIDNYGPVWIPKAGEKIELTPQNIAVYTRVIAAYEGNKVEMKNGKMYINDAEASSYTFKMNYYWAMGDNRHHSADSRAWGFVPEDHIVGKPLFIWMSMKNGGLGNGIRWNRIFRRADTK